MFGAYVDERLAVLDGWIYAEAGSDLDLSDGHIGAVFADQAGMVPVPTEIAIDNKLFKLQLRHGRLGMEGVITPTAAPGLAPKVSKPRPNQAHRGRARVRPTKAIATPRSKAAPKRTGSKVTATQPTTKAKEATGTAQAIGASRSKVIKDDQPSDPTATSSTSVLLVIGARRPINDATTSTLQGPAPVVQGPVGGQTRLPFAARGHLLRAHLGAKKFSRIIGAGSLVSR
jgi:hypothetical protein